MRVTTPARDTAVEEIAMSRWTRRSILVAGLGAAGCAALRSTAARPPVPTGGQRRRPAAADSHSRCFGSSLRHKRTGREVWPAADSDLLLSDYRGLELAINHSTLEPVADEVEAYGVFRAGLGRDFYGNVLDTLQQAGGYVRCRPGHAPRAGARKLYAYVYDFRLDNVRAVRGLEELIEQIRKDHGDPHLRVDILAHSNGGLLARYYARYGAAELPETGAFQPSFAGAAAIRRLLLVGTPNLGTLQPVLSHLRGEEIGLRRIPPEVVATCTGAAQMMPHPGVPWLVDLGGSVVHSDLYDIDTWRDFKWSLYDPRIAARTIERHGGGAEGRRYLEVLRAYMARNLARGSRFAESLAVAPSPEDVRPYVFGGDCEPTLARLLVESVSGRVFARERIGEIAAPVAGVDYQASMFEPGDSVVTRASLLGRRSLDISAPRAPDESLSLSHSFFLCERHQQLTGNRSFQDNLLNVLLNVDLA
jgi:pimeloyl-ACP methyl ester carboxylesterase